jgi:hypothetical protein
MCVTMRHPTDKKFWQSIPSLTAYSVGQRRQERKILSFPYRTKSTMTMKWRDVVVEKRDVVEHRCSNYGQSSPDIDDVTKDDERKDLLEKVSIQDTIREVEHNVSRGKTLTIANPYPDPNFNESIDLASARKKYEDYIEAYCRRYNRRACRFHNPDTWIPTEFPSIYRMYPVVECYGFEDPIVYRRLFNDTSYGRSESHDSFQDGNENISEGQSLTVKIDYGSPQALGSDCTLQDKLSPKGAVPSTIEVLPRLQREQRLRTIKDLEAVQAMLRRSSAPDIIGQVNFRISINSSSKEEKTSYQNNKLYGSPKEVELKTAANSELCLVNDLASFMPPRLEHDSNFPEYPPRIKELNFPLNQDIDSPNKDFEILPLQASNLQSRATERFPSPSPTEVVSAKGALESYNKSWTLAQSTAKPPLLAQHVPWPTRFQPNSQNPLSRADYRVLVVQLFSTPFNIHCIFEPNASSRTPHLVLLTNSPQSEKAAMLNALQAQLKLESARWHQDKMRALFGNAVAAHELVKLVWTAILELNMEVKKAVFELQHEREMDD